MKNADAEWLERSAVIDKNMLSSKGIGDPP
jgi:hypothetical protein